MPSFGRTLVVPSLPTRRSSDLLEIVDRFDLALRIKSLRRPRHRVQEHQSFGRELLFQDRKSTRLNSSHPSISYAVFCLKKKIRCAVMSVDADRGVVRARTLVLD